MLRASNLKPTTRSGRARRSREHYLAGKSRSPYCFGKLLDESLSESYQDENQESAANTVLPPGINWNKICSKCRPVLCRHADTFKSMKKQGTELKKVKKINPNPKRHDFNHYRDIKCQNEWLRCNVFDSVGNYLFCAKCVCAALHISKQRLARQRAVKQRCSAQPTQEMTKNEVEEKRLQSSVIMPDGCEQCFSKWWKTVPTTSSVRVRYPHARHGLAGKVSNSAKVDTRHEFLRFVDLNSQPNGRSSDSYSPTHYFLPKFTTIQTPKAGVRNYEQRYANSIVAEFNRTQQEQGKPTMSNFSASKWLKEDRPKHAIYPHKVDYCDTCAGMKNEIHSFEMRLKRLSQSGAAPINEIREVEGKLGELKKNLESHRQSAQDSLKSYNEAIQRCQENWKKITDLEQVEERTEEKQKELDHLKENFILVLAAGYQQLKLVPYWGLSPQPGCTYYLQKMSFDVFGIVNHCDNQGYVYIIPETIGPKNTDHTLSYITHFLTSPAVPTWVKRIHLFMDNAGSTNKNFYSTGYCQELVQQRLFQFVRLSFMIAGHTKFSPDRLFAKIAIAYKSDVFTGEELVSVCSAHATVTLDNDGSIVRCWREKIEKKYTKLPGIRALHDLVTVMHPTSGDVILRVQRFCYTGQFSSSKMKLTRGSEPTDDAIPKQEDSYKQRGSCHELSTTKLNHLKQMYREFIPRERWPSIIIELSV